MLPLHIYTEGDKQRGLGHLTRCSAYAAAWQQAGGSVFWYVDGDDYAHALLKNEQVSWGKWQDVPEYVSTQSAIALVDSYIATLSVYEAIAGAYHKVVYMDDNYRMSYSTGLVIHAAPGERVNFNGKARWVYGPEWQPLRPAFWNLPCRYDVIEDIASILIMMGGTDIHNLTPIMLNLVRKIYPHSRIHVIGSQNQKIQENCIQHSMLDADQIARLMQECDIAVSAGGQTIYELAACGTPAIIIATADNQQLQIEGWKALGGFQFAGNWSHQDLSQNILDCLENLRPAAERKKYSTHLQGIVDGFGVKRMLSWVMN